MSLTELALICTVVYGAKGMESRGWAAFWCLVWLCIAFYGAFKGHP